jgi:hypothetical protein
MRTIEDVLNRLRAEFLEMRGLRLKAEQVERLCGIERTMCQLVLDSLVDRKFLCIKSDGHYARLTTGHHPRLLQKPEINPSHRASPSAIVECQSVLAGRP